jgi:hypothetical protein
MTKKEESKSKLYSDKDEKDSYKAYGSYDFYKRQVLERMFKVHGGMQVYDRCWYSSHWYQEYDKEKHKHDNAPIIIPDKSPTRLYHLTSFTDVQAKMINVITSLKGQIEYLYPKIAKLDEDKQKKYYEIFDDFLDLKKHFIIQYVYRSENWKVYRAYVQLIEDLGYSDMNVSKGGDMNEDW